MPAFPKMFQPLAQLKLKPQTRPPSEIAAPRKTRPERAKFPPGADKLLTKEQRGLQLLYPGSSTFLQRGSPPPPPWRLLPGFSSDFLHLDADAGFPYILPPQLWGCSSIG